MDKKIEEEFLLIRDIIADNCIAIYHIGSTSVPELAAKPIIDIMVVVRSLEKADDVAEHFSKIGYEYLGEFEIAGRRYLRKCEDEHPHQIHIFQTDDWNNIGRHHAFRDYMRTHKKARDEYAKIKISLAQQFPYDIDGYCDGKANFVREMEELALSQFDGRWDQLHHLFWFTDFLLPICCQKPCYISNKSEWLPVSTKVKVRISCSIK